MDRQATGLAWLLAALQLAVVVASLSALGTGVAAAYIGPSYLELPGVASGWKGPPYRNWLRVSGNYWQTDEVGIFARRNLRRQRMQFSAPPAPRKGASTLIVAIDKRSPALGTVMALCAARTKLPDLTYAESSVMSRGLSELGERPADIPEFYEYRLKDVVFSDCPVVADAPEQALVVSFADIEWLNYHDAADAKAFTLEPAVLKPVSYGGATRSFVMSWHAYAFDVAADQCTRLNERAPQDDYYAFMSPAEAAAERAALASTGGPNYESGQMGLRGPHKLNACALPGIIRDPGIISPQPTVARGMDLDGDDGRGNPPAGIRKHVNYTAEDGRTGIDNQLYTVLGCMPGFQGHKGFLMQFRNEQRRNGLLSVLIQISGVDNEQNDDNVDVTVLYSKDPMAKSAGGTQILPDYTFRLSDNPEFAHYATRLHGRIVNGEIITEPVDHFQMHLGIDTELNLFKASMRLRILPDGSLKGVLGGYENWHKLMQVNANSNSELHYGYQCPGMYNAFKRLADGLWDPVAGEFNGISSAYDIEGVPAYVPPRQQEALVTSAGANGAGAR